MQQDKILLICRICCSFLLNVATWSQFTSDCLWISSWLTKDYEQGFPRTQDLTLSIQRQLKLLIERKDSHDMLILQEWYTFRWTRMTFLSDPAAQLIPQGESSRVLRIYIVCWNLESRSIQGLDNQIGGCSLLQLTEIHETLIRTASEQAAFARMMERGQFYTTNEYEMYGNSSTSYSENTQNDGILRVRH